MCKDRKKTRASLGVKSVVLIASIFGMPTQDAFSPIITVHQRRWDRYTVRSEVKTAAVSQRGVGALRHEPSTSTETSSESLEIGGILPQRQFKSRSALHETLSELRQQIPRLLSVPLSESSAEKVYTETTRLIVGNDDPPMELSSDRTELISLCNTFVLALAASLQARNMVSSLMQRRQQNSNAQDEPSVECQIILLKRNSGVSENQDFDTIEVRWEALIPIQQPIATSSTKIRGVSRLDLDPDTKKVASHQLSSVFINDSLLEANAVGQSLASLRQTVKGIQGSPLLQPLLSATASSPVALSALEVFQQARDDFISRQLSQTDVDPKLAPLFVALDSNASKVTLLTASDTSFLIPVDSSNSTQSAIDSFPLPGTTSWPVYVSCHRLAECFVDTIIPMLSGSEDVTFDDSLFDPNSCLYASDGSILLRTGTLLSGYYKSLAALRTGTRTKWNLKNVRVLSWGTKVGTNATEVITEIEVEFSTEVRVPGSSSVGISGIDVYKVSSFLDSQNSRGCIEEVQQRQLLIGDNMKSSETLMLMRSVASAVESSSGRISLSDGFWLDLLRRLSGNDSKRPIQQTVNRLPIRSDNAAVTVYRIMEALHQDWVDTLLATDFADGSGRSLLPPGNAFMPENVKLIGYLGEPLLRGRASYIQAYQVAVRSFHAALKSRSLQSVKEPAVQVELSASGNIVWTLSLFLKVSAPFVVALPGLEGASSVINNNGALSTINIAAKSEFCLCPETGQILQHRLLETRINGRLTPGDVVSRWIKGSRSEASDDADPLDWVRISLESVEWLRSLNDKPA